MNGPRAASPSRSRNSSQRSSAPSFSNRPAPEAFPDLGHGYYYAVDARLHGYLNVGQWALIVETVGYSPRGRQPHRRAPRIRRLPDQRRTWLWKR
ncbi:DUF7003 family protein [Micromonospora sp. NPDC006431]|uniref:DUF7003 family protein n=1 Tax=Micromonospora sp. NPDC006431 TaxID=3364235 RepID=UPI0036A77F69